MPQEERMPDNDISARMRRAISATVARQWTQQEGQFQVEFVFDTLETLPGNEEERKSILRKIREWYSDRRILFISDTQTESAFSDQLFENPLLVLNPDFMKDWNSFRNSQVSKMLMMKNDPLSNLAILELEKENEIPDERKMIAHYFAYYENLGPERSGRLEEVIGPMGSGKSNYLAWKAIRALQRGYVVMTNMELSNVPQSYHSNYYHANNLLDLLKETVKLKNNGYDNIIFWLLDEQGRVRGGSSVTRSTKEARYLSELLTMIRKFGVFLTRARQVDNIPDDQRGWVSQIVSKNPERPDIVHIEYLSDGQSYEEYEFIIDNMGRHYNTNEIGEFDYNVDTEAMQKFVVASVNQGKDQFEAISDFLHITKRIEEKKTKATMKKLVKMAGPGRGENPNSLRALEEINRKKKEKAMENNTKDSGDK